MFSIHIFPFFNLMNASKESFTKKWNNFILATAVYVFYDAF